MFPFDIAALVGPLLANHFVWVAAYAVVGLVYSHWHPDFGTKNQARSFTDYLLKWPYYMFKDFGFKAVKAAVDSTKDTPEA